MTACVILAGGHASRMGGGDKGLQRLGGMTLLDLLLARLRPQCTAIALNANGDPARFAAWRLQVVADPLPDRPGPLAGILAGLDWAAGAGFDSVVSVAVDTPFLPDDLVARLHAAGPVALAASPDADGKIQLHPTFGLWPTALAGDLRAAIAAGERRPRAWALRHGAKVASFPRDDHDPFFNVNRPEDLAEAGRIYAAISR